MSFSELPRLSYLQKIRGVNKTPSPARVGMKEIFWSWLGSFFGIGLVSFLDTHYFSPGDWALLIGSFGASAVLIYGAPTAPLAQPRNLVGGHIVSAIVGVAVFHWIGTVPWLAAALAVSLAIVAMHWTVTLHPPGGATALIAVIGSDKLHALGFYYVLAPVGLGSLLLLLVAILVNNLTSTRHYPLYWW